MTIQIEKELINMGDEKQWWELDIICGMTGSVDTLGVVPSHESINETIEWALEAVRPERGEELDAVRVVVRQLFKAVMFLDHDNNSVVQSKLFTGHTFRMTAV
ncbi:hypothetical protein CJ179_38565 [Rhodococcus sp. ACS1]|uniref:hypothetical protein n=1 Tax=Rhodococcus sp. ACS1 TaxID=2028570 RepID=UPI000BB11A91|nr:hypothetical protein [Rhodococcus sp. ACS1]PBC38504.1 hypothetical protein CJ179_38565 [Rhodococcus sp. ACS1]